MNILITSVGTRNKIIQYFKENIDGKIITTDMQNIAPAIYESDKYYIVPSINDDSYIDIIVDICKKEQINAVISLIDPELSLLAKNKKTFDELGIKLICSSYEACELSLDKMRMYRWLKEHNYNCAKSYDNINEFLIDKNNGLITYPVFVKPIKGSASIAISKVYDDKTLETLFSNSNNMLIQEYMNGTELGIDVYIDMISKEVVSIFAKKKLLMRAGETDKAISFKDKKLFNLVKKFVKEVGYEGQIDIDIFEINGEYYISEVNPRFGGGYPHAYSCGCNHIKMIANNVLGKINKENIGGYKENILMMKYNEISIKEL